MAYREDIGAAVFVGWEEMPVVAEVPTIVEILKKYYEEEKKCPNMKLSTRRRKAFVRELRKAYKATPKSARGDTLVPADVKCLASLPIEKEEGNSEKPKKIKPEPVFIFQRYDFRKKISTDYYGIRYAWPEQEGFFEGKRSQVTLHEGMLIDRIGAPNEAIFAAPLSDINSSPQDISSRALPYFFDEEDAGGHHAYHMYRVRKSFVVETSQEIDEDFINDKTGELKHVEAGVVAQAFRDNPPDGGGQQYKLPTTIGKLIQKGYIEEVDLSTRR